MKIVVVSGAAAAIILGGLGGKAMHPDLSVGADRPNGPQMFADWPGEGSTGPFDHGTSFDAAYRVAAAYPVPAGGKVPDYVYGTDWKRAMSPINDSPRASDTAYVERVSYDEPARADDPDLARGDDTTVAERDPRDPSHEPVYDRPTYERRGYERPSYERPDYQQRRYDRASYQPPAEGPADDGDPDDGYGG